MPKGTYLGDVEQLVMLALLRLGDRAYGMTVRRELEAASLDSPLGSEQR